MGIREFDWQFKKVIDEDEKLSVSVHVAPTCNKLSHWIRATKFIHTLNIIWAHAASGRDRKVDSLGQWQYPGQGELPWI